MQKFLLFIRSCNWVRMNRNITVTPKLGIRIMILVHDYPTKYKWDNKINNHVRKDVTINLLFHFLIITITTISNKVESYYIFYSKNSFKLINIWNFLNFFERKWRSKKLRPQTITLVAYEWNDLITISNGWLVSALLNTWLNLWYK